ncbi:hybrid sensor histidine kinase/response regulator [Peristeroidobacter agariperforans]|uniref:hybrid sensor histidine kinase/response regulator n=1 Tax=Peristeroidobacter agariperforans TaxID=268404 RepID=UPI00101C5A9B|nr:PAS domain-containing hybrid sensor histidine kinase/response regulator [Peristeroidobacter agariperforans]
MRLALARWPTPAALIGEDGHINAGNRAFARLFGCEQCDLRQRAIDELIPAFRPLDGGDAPAVRHRATGHRLDGSTFPLRFIRLPVDAGDTRCTLVGVKPRGSRGQVVPIRNCQNDARLRAAVKAGRIGTWIWDLRQRTAWWDSAMYQLWEIPPDGILPIATATALLHPEDREWVGRSMDHFVNSGAREFALEFRLLRPDRSTQWVSISGEIQRNPDGEPTQMIGATTDVTARKNAEHALHHAQKMEALGTLAGGIAHDFNNILLAIAGNTRLAEQELPPDHPVRNMLDQIAKASVRATDLVNRILTFSRQGDCRREVLPLQSAVEDAIKLLRATLPGMIEISCTFAKNLPPVRADATQVHQIIINLVTNAAHAIGDNARGSIAVTLDDARVAQDDAPAPQLRAGRYVRLSVTDTGSGMDKATLDRIFDPFFTTKPAGRGTGLGLSVVDGIMRSHEGAIFATSQPGRGTTFRLYFPVADLTPLAENSLARDIAPPEAPSRGPREIASTRAEGRGRRVMYIDDEDALVYLMTRVLQKCGYRVTGFTDAEQALQALRERPAEFDVVVTDLSMPGMSGFHVAQVIREIRADLPVVVTSGYVRAEDRETAKEVGVRDLVPKPDTVEELAGVLAQVFEQRRSDSPRRKNSNA